MTALQAVTWAGRTDDGPARPGLCEGTVRALADQPIVARSRAAKRSRCEQPRHHERGDRALRSARSASSLQVTSSYKVTSPPPSIDSLIAPAVE